MKKYLLGETRDLSREKNLKILKIAPKSRGRVRRSGCNGEKCGQLRYARRMPCAAFGQAAFRLRKAQQYSHDNPDFSDSHRRLVAALKKEYNFHYSIIGQSSLITI